MIREKEYKVVVTAAAPFKENETNPSQEVKNSIPSVIDREGKAPIRIIKYPVDFRNVLSDMDLIPPLWSGAKRVYDPGCEEGQEMYIDAMLHLGMNFSETWTVEKRARRDGYDWTGDDKKPLPKHNGGRGARWEGLPEDLKPVFDVDSIAKHLSEQLPDTNTGTSTEAGLAYCEFIYYSSLATLYRQDEKARALFLHHAGKRTDDEGIKQGAQVATSVICSMIDQLEGL